MNSRNELKWAIRDDAYMYRDEPFTLKNGAQTRHYVDCRRMLLVPQHLKAASCIVSSVIYANWEARCVAGVLTGAAPLVAALGMAHGWPGIWIRGAVKDHGTKRRVEFASRLSEHDMHSVVLVDDVATSGRTLMDAVEQLRVHDCRVVGCVVLVDRGYGAKEHLAEIGVPYRYVFTMDDICMLHKNDNADNGARLAALHASRARG